MITTPATMRMLSNRFYGNKYFLITHYTSLKEGGYSDENVIKQLLSEIVPDYIKELCDADPTLLTVFTQFVVNQLTFAYEAKYIFEKCSSLFELSVYLFRKAFEKRWNKDKTFEELKQILVRHSLFRPPHCIFIFTLDEVKSITFFFLSTFFRFFNAYFFAFTPLVDLEVRTEEVKPKRDIREEELEQLRLEGEKYDGDMDEELLQQIMSGNSIHNISPKKREELMRMKAEKERQERIDRILKAKLQELEVEFEEKIKTQDQEFLKKVDETKNPKKK